MVQAGTTLGTGTPSAPIKNSEVAGFGSSSPVSERLALAARGRVHQSALRSFIIFLGFDALGGPISIAAQGRSPGKTEQALRLDIL